MVSEQRCRHAFVYQQFPEKRIAKNSAHLGLHINKLHKYCTSSYDTPQGHEKGQGPNNANICSHLYAYIHILGIHIYMYIYVYIYMHIEK